MIKSFQNWNFSIPVLIFPPPLARLSYWRVRLWPRCEAAVVWLICYDPVTTCRRTGGRGWLASPQRSHSQSSHLYQLHQTIRTSRREERRRNGLGRQNQCKKNILEKECKKYYWNWNVMMLFYIYWVSTSWCPPLTSHPRSQVSESWVSHYSAPLNILTSPIREGFKKGSTPYAFPHIMLNE